MGAAAQFQRPGIAIKPLGRPQIAAHRDDAHLIPVFFTEQRLCANGARIIRGHDAGIDCPVLADIGIHIGFHLGQFLRRQRL